MAKKVKNSSPPPPTYAWKPQEGPQLDALLATWCSELLFGGARGGGKSQWLLGDFLQDVEKYGKHWNGIIFRRSYGELEELIRASKEIYPKSGAEYYIQAKEWRWPNGAKLRFAYIERDSDAERYMGHQFSFIGFDELGNYPSPDPYKLLIACLRSGDADIPTKRIRATANPGGPGHHWVYEHFISRNPKGYEPYDDPLSGMSRMFIPSRVTDNKILMERDPGYINRLRNVGSEALVRAWLDGDWSAIQGAFFDEFSLDQHVIPTFDIPDYWPKWASVDWGFAKPFSVGWYTIADNSMEDAGIPNGSIIQYREWYGGSAPNVGIRLPIDKFAAGVREKTTEKIEYVVCDPSMFIEDGGPSLAEAMSRPPHQLPCIRGDNKRIPGWNRMRTLLRWKESRPKLYFFPCCTHLLRTLPIMQHSKDKPEDMETDGVDDHCEDQTRYSVMSRIDPRNKPESGFKPMHGIEHLTINRLWSYYEEELGKSKRF